MPTRIYRDIKINNECVHHHVGGGFFLLLHHLVPFEVQVALDKMIIRVSCNIYTSAICSDLQRVVAMDDTPQVCVAYLFAYR